MNDLQTEIFDIKWSPSHPSVFATGDCEGNIDLWNLGKETEQFIYRKSDESKKSINKLRWSLDGKKLLSGNSNGIVKLWRVDKQFSQPIDEDIAKLEQLIKLK